LFRMADTISRRGQRPKEVPPPTQPEPPSQNGVDVTAMAFAQWVSELKQKSIACQHHTHGEIGALRQALDGTAAELRDVASSCYGSQQQIQTEIGEFRESLARLLHDITASVRTHATANQSLRLKAQELHDRLGEVEVAHSSLAETAENGQNQVRESVQGVHDLSEVIRQDVGALRKYNDQVESMANDRFTQIQSVCDRSSHELANSTKHREEVIVGMASAVEQLTESLGALHSDLNRSRSETMTAQSSLHVNAAVTAAHSKPPGAVGGGGGSAQAPMNHTGYPHMGMTQQRLPPPHGYQQMPIGFSPSIRR